MPFNVRHGRHQCDSFAISQSNSADAMGAGRFKGQPNMRVIPLSLWWFCDAPTRGRCPFQGLNQHGGDINPPLHRLDVPRKSKKVTPIAGFVEQKSDRGDVLSGEGSGKGCQPVLRGLVHVNLPMVQWRGRHLDRQG